MGLQEDFEAAAQVASHELPDTLSNDEKLELYALFKQSKEGDCHTGCPTILDPKGRAKWFAWDKKKGTSKEAAMQAYVDLVAALKAKHGTK